MVTILVPRGAEAAAMRRGARGATVFAIAAGSASSALPAEISPGDFIVVSGLCGSLHDARVGDVVVYSELVGDEGREALDSAAVDRVCQFVPAARRVVAYTAPRVVTDAAARTLLAGRYGADVVDMEATYVARALRERQVRFAMVRVVSDDPRFDLPDIGDALDPSGAIRPLALAGAFARRPLAAVRFIRDVQRSLGVLASLGAAFAAPEASK